MTHQADDSFFDTKRDWSRRKDRILDHYLHPYLTIVAKIGKPILVVDGFAGPGKFGDGHEGSPLIICRRASEQRQRGVNVEVLCIEESVALHGRLSANLKPYMFANAVRGSFREYADQIAMEAKHRTVFMYLDPYAIRGLEWSGIKSAAEAIHSHDSSVELLMNLNMSAFARRARAALSRTVPTVNPEIEDEDDLDAGFSETPTVETLSRIVGGDWWRETVTKGLDFGSEVAELMARFGTNLRTIFGEVCYVPIKAKPTHTIPKYYLVYGTRHVEGLTLMNDEMVKAIREGGFQSDFVVAMELDERILNRCESKTRREELVLDVLRLMFGRVKVGEIRKRIDDLLSSHDLQLVGSAGSGKENDILVLAPPKLF